MALTYRQTKGSALTIQELDANFAYFTGSQSISGSTIISGSLTVDGPLYVTGSSVIFDTDNGAYIQFQVSGTADFSRDVIVRDDLFVYDDSNLRGDTNVGYDSGSDSNLTFGYSLQVTQSATNNSGSAIFKGGVTIESLPTTEPTVTGSLWISGSSLNHPSSSYLMVFNP
jgi:hypothetical protein|tara:strand:+ start:1106 stop:1615 length:510 start_codon:yes stop_codon:yes gene_type:complete